MTDQQGTGSGRIAIVLAAGEGKRMKSPLPKVLHEIGGAPMLSRVLDTARAAGFDRQVVVVGHGRDAVAAAIQDPDVEFVVQAEQHGTGHAVQMAEPALEGFEGEVAVLCGDVPLLSEETLAALIAAHENGHYAATVLTFRPDDPTGYGRIFRDADGDVERIVEQRDLPEGIEAPGEVNSGTYCFSWNALRPVLDELRPNNDQGELYLTDTLAMLRERGERVGAYLTDDPVEVSGVNSPQQLAELDRAWRERHPDSGGAG